MVICFRVTPKTKIDFFKNRFCGKIPVFKKLPGFLNFDLLMHQLDIYFPIEQDTEVENRSIISTTYCECV